MTVKITTAVASAALLAMVAKVDDGAAAPSLKVYSGTVPANVTTALTDQVELLSAGMSDPAFDTTVTDGGTYVQVPANTLTLSPSVASGTATFFRIFDGNGTAIVQGTVTASGGGGDLEIISGVAINSGVMVAFNTFNMRMPKG